MARPRKRWRYSTGRKGETVAIYEPRLAGDLRWDYREENPETGELERRRPWVDPPMRVRLSENEPTDPLLVKAARELCDSFHHELRGASHRQRLDAHDLTVSDAFALYHDPRDGNLPRSRSARVHHKASRDFWTERFGEDALWNDVRPAQVEGAIRDLVDAGMIPTARKRFANLRTVAKWLREKMRLRGLEDPTAGVETKDLTAGHEPRRPRYSTKEVEKLVEASAEEGGRIHLFTVLMADSGARAIQVRNAWRSGLDIELDDPPPESHAPHGWLMLPAVKKQAPMLVYLTRRERAAIERALGSYLAKWEAQYQADELEDYPLLPGGRIDRDEMTMEPIGDRALRYEWKVLEKAADVETKPRRAFHGIRRAWVKKVEEGSDIETVTHAGGWSRREIVESTYVPKRRFQHLERAREIMEKEGDDAE